MTKKQILEVLNLMLNDWRTGLNEPLNNALINKLNVDDGFCIWLQCYYEEVDVFDDRPLIQAIISELKVDHIQVGMYTKSNTWWYPCVNDFNDFAKEKKIIAFQYRINNLKRTIERLEKTSN